MFLLITLSALAMAASALVSARARFGSRAEFLLSCCVLWNFLILVPIHVLGLTNQLTATKLAVASALLSSLVGGASFLGAASPSAHLEATIDIVGGALLAPADALALTLKARSFVFLGLVASFGVLAYTIWLSYLIPSDSWDGLWYHELTIGFAVQNQGYAPIDLPVLPHYPANMIQQANGYPRNCEMTNLWFGIFSGRDLIEVVNSLAGIPLMLGTYLIARRCSTDRIAPLGWASAVALMPGVVLQYRSTYMDVHVAAFNMAALHFCTRPALRVADGWLAMVALSLLIGAKSMALATVPFLWLAVACLLIARNWRTARWSVVGVLAGGASLIVAMAAVCYVRNWIVFGGPFWPISLDVPSLGIHFKGLSPASTLTADEGHPTVTQMYQQITQNRPPGKDFADTGPWGYGIGFALFVLPLGLFGLVVLALSVAKMTFLSRAYGEPMGGEKPGTWNLALVTALLLVSAASAPKIWYPRYNIHLAAGLMLLINWMGWRRPRLSEGVTAATLAGHLTFLFWASPGWGATFEAAIERSKQSHATRDVLSPSPWGITPEVATARDKELGAGDVVAFSADTVFVFVTQLWNERYTNKLVYVPPTSVEDFLEGANRVNAKWVVVGEGSALAAELAHRQNEWQRIGQASRGYPQLAYRRRR